MMKGTDNKENRAREDVLEELFRHATVREQPPTEAEQAIRESLHRQWKDMTRQRKRWKYRMAFAVAASLMLAAVAATMLFQGPGAETPAVRVAEIQLIKGTAYRRSAPGEPVNELTGAAPLETGQEVSTAHGSGLALRWKNGITLRLDQNSRIWLDTAEQIELAAGRIYVDTGSTSDSVAALVLATPAGPVRHVGTRYMVAVNFGATSVSVREGRVLFGEAGATASAGEKLVEDAAGNQRREDIPVYGDAWLWAEGLAQPVSPEGRSVTELLDWIGRETGRAVEYASPDAARLAAETRLHGDVGLEPMQALQLISRSTDLAAELVDGKIVIRADFDS
jgi:ferric-dicitrate binding protein FerR (iron transport regulator)